MHFVIIHLYTFSAYIHRPTYLMCDFLDGV